MYVSVEPGHDLKIIGDKPRKLIVEKPNKMHKNQKKCLRKSKGLTNIVVSLRLNFIHIPFARGKTLLSHIFVENTLI